jgi:PTH1 family peptidyl-tRNA hydrolase
MTMKLIVGLGNPGKEYFASRHNVGFLCLNYLARLYKISFDKKQSRARVGQGLIAENEVLLAKPQTYMNASGQAVALLLQRYKLGPEDLIIIHDDIDLPLGKIRIRQGSSSGGHKGAQSIIDILGSRDFIRIRVGVGRPDVGDEIDEARVIDYVLSDFSKDETGVIDEAIHRVSEAVVCLLTKGLVAAMNEFN